ncbi:MAG: hypothetical protein ABEI11_03280 [Haloarculaceae archaeon]
MRREPDSTGSAGATSERAQLVLAAAAVVAVALAPVVLAYLQLGYHADVTAAGDYEDPSADAVRVLERATHEAALNATGPPWNRRSAVVGDVRAALAPRLRTLEGSRAVSGTGVLVGYNDTAARAWADANCPGGPARQFGACVADRGVVVQNRTGETVVLAVAYDVRVVTRRGRTALTVVVRAVGGRA